MAPETLVLVGTLGGALIGVVGASIPAYIAAKGETARNRQRLAVQAGLDEWKIMLADATAKASPGRRFQVVPAYSYILFHSRVIDLLDQRRLTPDALKALHQEIDDLLPGSPKAPEA